MYNVQMDYASHFKGKKITVMGLGLLGRGVGDAKFMAEQGAELIVTDLKADHDLRNSLQELAMYPHIEFHLEGHRMEDFKDRDYILMAAGVPQDSPYIKEARKNKIPIKMSASWFAELAQIPFVGITGTRGKSTTTMMLKDIMESAGMHVILGGNIRGVSTLALLPQVTKDSIGLFELDSWQCQGFGEAGIGPNVGVFTTFYPDHQNYYKGSMDAYLADKMQLFVHQKPEDTLVVGEQALPMLGNYKNQIKSRVVVSSSARLPKDLELKVPGEHNRANAACALEAARALGIDDDVTKTALEDFNGVPGRLEFLKEVNGVKIYNDNNSTTPDATIAALRAVGDPIARRVVLIMGGDDKQLDMTELVSEIPKWCSKVILFKERGTDRIRDQVLALAQRGVEVYEEEGLEATVKRAFAVAVPGETVLYSPAFSSFGKYFKNEFDRGDKFAALVNAL